MGEALLAALRLAAARAGTPVYVIDVAALEAAARELASAFPDPWLRHYALAANPLPPLVSCLAGHGIGGSVRSRGEWALANAAGLSNERLILDGGGKADDVLRRAARAAAEERPLRWVTVETEDEGLALETLARSAGLGRRGRPPVEALLRLQPGFDADPIHDRLLARTGRGRSIRWRGLALSLGTQLGSIDRWRDVSRRALALLALLAGQVETLDTLDFGGGFPVAPDGSPVPGPGRFARELPALLEAVPAARRPARLAVQPGRFLVARAGWLVASVLHTSVRRVEQTGPEPSPLERAVAGSPRTARRRQSLRLVESSERTTEKPVLRTIALDAGMPDLISAALHGDRHPVMALTSLGVPLEGTGRFQGPERSPATVLGLTGDPIDTFGEHLLPPLRRGDLVAIGQAGAYASSMASAFGGRPRRPEILLEPDGRLVIARRRGTIGSLR